jgi:type VI secretion system protein VasJ
VNLDAIRVLGERPVREDAPCGDSVRDEAEFEALQAEVRKLELPAGLQPDWQLVADKSAFLLAERSKDLLVACFLAYAAFRLSGYAGLAAGLQILSDLTERHWEGLFPELKRVRGRLAAMEWLASRAAREVANRSAARGDVTGLEDCQCRVTALGEAMEAKAEGAWALFGELRSALAEAAVAADQAAASEPAAGPSPAVAAAPAASPLPAAGGPGLSLPATISSDDIAAQALGGLRNVGLALAEKLRGHDPRNPVAYRLLRQMVWLQIRELPPATDGVTRIPPYQPPDLLARLEEAVGRGQWQGVLEQTEGRLASTVFCLDLNRYAWFALDALGTEYAAAADAILVETAGLLRRLPGLERLRFAGGAALAEPATLEWIRDRLRPAGASEVEGAAAAPSATPPAGEAEEFADLSRVRGEALALLRQKKATEAVRLLEERVSRSGSLRARVRWNLELARLLHEARAPETASLRLRDLYAQVDAARIEDWDPSLAAELAKSLLLSLRDIVSSGHQSPGDDLAVYREVRARLCRLDPAAALASEIRR